jgi:hypothetical protein
MTRRLAFLAAVLAVFAVASAPATASATGRYVAIGDSIAGQSDSYVDRFAVRLGIVDVHKLISGNTAAQALASVLPAARALIDDPTDTRVVTVQIGGHDHLTGNCSGGWNRPSCDFGDSLAALLGGLGPALDSDPGSERFLLVAYYNPASGVGDDRERFFDVGLRGADARIDTAGYGDDWGLTDMSGWLACRRGATLVDPWSAFKAGGQSLMADSLHPNASGQEILTDLLENPAAGGPAPTCPPTTPFAQTEGAAADGQAHGVVEPRLSAARWWFEYGPTAAYGNATPVQSLAPSAGARAVAAALPAGTEPMTYHVRLVAENDVGRFAGDDRVVPMPGIPVLEASLRGRRLRRTIIARGVAIRVRTTGTLLDVRARLRRRGHDPVVLQKRLAWRAPGATRTLRVPLTARGRRLLRRAARPRLALTLVASGAGGESTPVRLTLRPR